MACLDIKVGSFSPLGGWLSGTMNANTANGATVENSAATGLKVSKNGITKSIINTSNKTHFLVFGTPQNYVLGCLFDAGLASVIVYEITGTGITEHFLGGVSSSQLPIVSQSVGNGNLFLIAYHNAPSNVIPIIYKSENGELLLSAGNFQPNNTISADAVDTVALPKKLRILDGVMQVALGSWPLGRSAAIPLTLDFPDVVIGAAVPLALTKQTLQGRIKN
ncbi:MAG: hypothetical protein ABIO32_03600, partial [Ferruginibacter sp.]